MVYELVKVGDKMINNIYASIEFGTHSIKLLVSEFWDQKQNILFIDEQLTKGIQVGAIIDKAQVYNDAKKLISKCEDFLAAKIKRVVLMLPSINLKTKNVSYDITITDNRVRGKHIKNLFNKVYEEESKSKENYGEIAAIYPNSFTSLKMKKHIDNPIGEATREIYASLEIAYENQQMIYDYISIIEKLGIEVIDIIPNVVGYKRSLLTREEMSRFTCVIDIGANSTTISIFSNQMIQSSETFKIGTSIVTEALKNKLNLLYDDAEDFKITHGNCIAKEATDEVVLEQRLNDGSITYITSEYVAQIIEEKYLDIIRVIKRYLLESGLKSKIMQYVLIGGGVAIENFEKLFKNNFGENVAIRSPNLIGTRHPKYSSIISGQYNILYLEQLFEEKYEMVVFNNK